MKKLILIRHAKSSWKQTGLDDHDRPLNKRGERDSAFMAKILLEKKLDVDFVFSSSALRAITTAKVFAKELNLKKHQIEKTGYLYLADTDELANFVKNIDDTVDCAIICAHNPGITWFAYFLTGIEIDNIPTCGMVAIEFDVEHWNQVEKNIGRQIFFEYPKMYFSESDD